jgi:hypothetical protein
MEKVMQSGRVYGEESENQLNRDGTIGAWWK